MSSQGHIGRALAGAFALARFDRKGMEYFDLSYDGFWRSFSAIAVALPIIAVWAAAMAHMAGEAPAPDDPSVAAATRVPQNVVMFSVTYAVAFAAGWLFFPVAMIWGARMLDMSSRYVPLIVANNWARVIATYAVVTPLVLYAGGMLSADMLVSLEFLIVVFILAYRWFVIRAATDAPGVTAAGLLLLDLLGAALVETVVGQVYWLFDPGAPLTPENT